MKHYENLSLNDIKGEIWLPVIGFETYYIVSNYGRIKRVFQTTYPIHILRQNINRGYCNVCLCVKNTKHTKRVHRLMGFAFLKTVKDKPYINHKNGIRDDNRLHNIEWCNNSENQKHSFEKLGRIHHRPNLGMTGNLCKNSKPLYQLDLNGAMIRTWDSTADITRELGFNNISLACTQGVVRHGFKWRYAS